MERINSVHCKNKNLINIHNFVPENSHIRMHTARQHMQKWKPMVAFRPTQILDQFGYNMSNNDHSGATVELYDAYSDADYW